MCDADLHSFYVYIQGFHLSGYFFPLRGFHEAFLPFQVEGELSVACPLALT